MSLKQWRRCLLGALISGAVLLAAGIAFLPPAAAQAGPAGAGCQFLSAPGATAAFCETLAGARPGGHAGDLGDARWSVARLAGDNNSNVTLLRFPPTPASACKAGVTSTSADSDILVCDSASGHAGQFETTLSAQNYGLLSLRPRQPFDFTGRIGTISYNVDAVTEGGLSWWTSLFVTDDPNPGANNTENVTGVIPRNGVGVNQDDSCGMPGTQMRVNRVYTFADYIESNTPLNNTACVLTQRGSPNHIEVRLSQTSIEVWASDFSRDGGVTFPSFRRIGSAAISLGFSTGYVHFQQENAHPSSTRPSSTSVRAIPTTTGALLASMVRPCPAIWATQCLTR
jgi:hypothetical protein